MAPTSVLKYAFERIRTFSRRPHPSIKLFIFSESAPLSCALAPYSTHQVSAIRGRNATRGRTSGGYERYPKVRMLNKYTPRYVPHSTLSAKYVTLFKRGPHAFHTKKVAWRSFWVYSRENNVVHSEWIMHRVCTWCSQYPAPTRCRKLMPHVERPNRLDRE